jgi:hypothetical protein
VLLESTLCGVPLCAQIALLESTLLLLQPAFAWTVLQGPPVLLELQHVSRVHHNFFYGFFLQYYQGLHHGMAGFIPKNHAIFSSAKGLAAQGMF